MGGIPPVHHLSGHLMLRRGVRESPYPPSFPLYDTDEKMWGNPPIHICSLHLILMERCGGNPPIHLSFLHLIPMERCGENFLIHLPTSDNYVEMWPVEWIPPSTFFPTICHLVLTKLCRGNPPIHLPTIWYKRRDVTCGGNPHINLLSHQLILMKRIQEIWGDSSH